MRKAIRLLAALLALLLLFSGCGLVILVSGLWMLWRKFRNRQLPPDRPDIIDAL